VTLSTATATVRACDQGLSPEAIIELATAFARQTHGSSEWTQLRTWTMPRGQGNEEEVRSPQSIST